MTNHTHGPWTVDYEHRIGKAEYIRAFIPDDTGGEMYDIASVACDETGEANANARLIASAPELLALLREAHDAIATGDGDFSPSGDWFREASAAIEKATGELADEVCPYHEWDCR